MLNIIIEPFRTISDLDNLVSLTYIVRQKNNYLKDKETEVEVRNELEKLQVKYKFILFRAYSNSKLLGFLLLYVNTPKFGIIWDWNPIICPDKNEDYIAKELLRSSIEYSIKNDITRIEVCFSIENEYHRKLYDKQLNWFKTLNFYKLTEEVSMELPLKGSFLQGSTLPKDYNIKPLKTENLRLLSQIAYKIFNNSEDSMFLKLGEEEKRVMCEKYFDLKEPIIQDASYILRKHDEIIGFSITRDYGTKADLRSFGILPKQRNKGLAKYLLLYTLQSLYEKGFESVYLDVVKENVPAYTLYTKVGFKIITSTEVYALNC